MGPPRQRRNRSRPRSYAARASDDAVETASPLMSVAVMLSSVGVRRPDAALPQARTESQRVLVQHLPLGALRQLGTAHDLVQALGPGGVAVRPVGGKEPQVLAQLLHAERQGALPRVD